MQMDWKSDKKSEAKTEAKTYNPEDVWTIEGPTRKA